MRLIIKGYDSKETNPLRIRNLRRRIAEVKGMISILPDQAEKLFSTPGLSLLEELAWNKDIMPELASAIASLQDRLSHISSSLDLLIEEARPKSANPGERIKVLIVNRDPGISSNIASLLRTEPDVDIVRQAYDGYQALWKAESLNPDLVMTSVMLPGIDGIELTKRLRERHPLIKVAVMTILADLEEEVLASGASSFMLLPLSKFEIIDEIRTIFDKRREHGSHDAQPQPSQSDLS